MVIRVRCGLVAALLVLCQFATLAHASVQVIGTRVIFPAKDGEVTVRLTNDNNRPALVESWIDRGDDHSTPDKVDTPFLITPPLFRMEAHKDQSLRIIFTHEQLPTDRESVFWLNVLEVPPKPNGPDAEQNYLQFAIRSRLKLFYRPSGLAVEPAKAPSLMRFSLVTDNGGYAVVVKNPSPYFVSISSLALGASGSSYSTEPGMVAPMSELKMPVHNLKQALPAGTPVNFESINDFGAASPTSAALGQ
ncbi:fimbrial biogenesis chaperone [Dyella amyloliquefaciens]|uniref:fimbrial biogenesis chaperone n=1 Tax=Dyella amyloliquefaciens TaxID=1770545 RepID=UPI00102E3156|nr:fimbria/pilus periplasmic chaperone [Dyella amyloliquefaciens]